MARVVHDRDGRVWTVSSRVHLVEPAAAGEFTIVEPADALLRAVLLTVSGVLLLAVLLSTPANLYLPSWVSGPVLLAAALAVAWWLTRRPWSITVTPAESLELGAAQGLLRIVRGPWAAHREATALAGEVAERTAAPRHDLTGGELPYSG